MIVELKGGMGNQMFEYAAGLAASIKDGSELKLNVAHFDLPNNPRIYSLGLWKGVTEELTREEPQMRGFYQSEKYFKGLRTLLLERFSPLFVMPEELSDVAAILPRISERSVFVTVRRGDYIGSKNHFNLGMDYYEEVAKIIKKKVIDPVFLVFSDDPEWCRTNFRMPGRTIIAGNFDQTRPGHLGREDAELWLMSRCRHGIMANSSYSWWGAYLNQREDGIVIAPKNWFTAESGLDSSEIILDRWTTL